ncbi:hypothetical protein B9Z55_004346 [Caenorhabditis nigoni]|uniref:DUF7809 domain-containing protein n=1 Tax=Caenorhabditis nigoni TaxID=1611254 RepID=A0A2G5UVY1_9PELO|nr:hypothetical protein B9Z55_004346 [Caenorhabditis nigoni]
MSKYLEFPSCATTPMCLHRETLIYILHGFIQEVKQNVSSSEYPPGDLKGQEAKLIQLLIDKSNQKLRMYGSAEELLKNINIFKKFPANHKCFGAAEEPYQTRPTIFKSLKDEKYIAKQDLFVILQNMILSVGKECPIEQVHLCAYYLKAREAHNVEFVKFDENFFDKMKNRLTEAMRNSQHSPAQRQQLINEFSKLTLPQIVEKFERLIPSNLNPNQHERLQVFLGRLFNSMPMRNRNDGMLMSYLLACLVTESLKTVIDENRDVFMPRRGDSKQPITVRVFEDGDQQFLMKLEIYNMDFLKSVVLETITLEQFVKNHGSNVEFIRYPITRAKHRASPIQGPSGSFYILAIDFFFELMRELILGEKFFQKLKPADLPEFFQNNFNESGKVFYPKNSPYFIETTTLLPFCIDEKSRNVKVTEVRNAKKDGFTLQNLKNELAHLGLTTTFPDIQDYAEGVYLAVDKNKKEKVLRTCDLFDAIEHCQLICVLERSLNLKKFVHTQKGCHRVYGLNCDDCAANKPKIDEKQELLILEKELTDLKFAQKKILGENQRISMKIEELEKKLSSLS